MITIEKSITNDQKSLSPKNKNEENNLNIVSGRKSYSGIMPSEKKSTLINNSINQSENIFGQENIYHLNFLESSINNISKELGEKEISNSFLSAKGFGKIKFDKNLETENDSSYSNVTTVKLNNTDNNNPYCYRIDNYYKIVEEMKQNNNNHFSLVTESDKSSLPIKKSINSDGKTFLIFFIY